MINPAQPQQDFLEEAERLSTVLDESPEDFVPTATRMGIAKRKAYYLVEIHKAFEGLPVDRERLLGIKWTKAQILARHVTRENVDYLLGEAERLPVHQLQKAIQGADSDASKHCVLLYLSDQDYRLLSKVLKSHGARPSARGLRNKEQALIKALKKLEV